MKHIPLRALALAVAALALVAVSIVATAAAKTQATTTITFWQTMNDEETKTLQSLIAKYENQNTGVKIDVTNVPFDQRENKFGAAAQAGTAPDLMRAEIADVANWAARGFLTDITRRVTAADKRDFLPAAFAYYNYAGKIWGLPQVPDAPALLYNKRMVKAAGLNPNKRSRDADRLQGWCSKVGKGKGIFLRGDSYWTQAWIWAYGGGLINTQSKQILVANKRSVAGMTEYKRQFCDELRVPEQGLRERLRQRHDGVQERPGGDDRQRPVVDRGRPPGQGVRPAVEPRRRTDPEGAGRAGLPGRRARVRDQPQLGQRRRGVQVRLLADAAGAAGRVRRQEQPAAVPRVGVQAGGGEEEPDHRRLPQADEGRDGAPGRPAGGPDLHRLRRRTCRRSCAATSPSRRA